VSNPYDVTKIPGGWLRTIPCWALGGIFLSVMFFIAIIVSGVSALAVRTACP